MGSVTLPRWALVGLVAALAASLVALAFLAGRASVPERRPDTEVVPPPSRTRTAPAPPAPSLPPATAIPEPVAPSEVDVQAPPAEARPTPEAAPPPAVMQPTPRPADETAAARVAAYLARVERVQGAGALPGSSDDAQRLLMAVLQGDTSGFDRMVADTRQAESDVKAIEPPPECRAYHASLVALLGESRALMTDLRAAIVGEDADRLATLGARAASLQTKAEELRVRDRELRRTYGLGAE